MRTETFAREVLERSEELKRDWNHQVERAAEEGVHVIYTDGYDRLQGELDTVSKNMLLDYHVKSEIHAVLAQLDKTVSNRNYFDSCRDFMAGQMDRREELEVRAAERGVMAPGHERYDTWSNVIDFAVGRCEGLMADPGNYGIHLDYIALRGESLESALARVREVLEDDDRHLAATLAGATARARASGCARSASPASLTIRRSSGSCGNSAPSARPGSSRARAGIGACESSWAWPRPRRDRDSRRSSDEGSPQMSLDTEQQEMQN